jgi:hypothetical protein
MLGVTRDNGSPGDYGNRVSLYPSIQRNCVTSWAETCNAWTNGEWL